MITLPDFEPATPLKLSNKKTREKLDLLWSMWQRWEDDTSKLEEIMEQVAGRKITLATLQLRDSEAKEVTRRLKLRRQNRKL